MGLLYVIVKMGIIVMELYVLTAIINVVNVVILQFVLSVLILLDKVYLVVDARIPTMMMVLTLGVFHVSTHVKTVVLLQTAFLVLIT